MTEKIYEDPVLGPVHIRKNPRARRISLRVNAARRISLTLPWVVPYRSGIAFLESRREWVQEVLNRIPERPAPDPAETERLRAAAKAVLPPRLAELASAHGFTYNRLTIKNNVSNWGSCSVRGNINLNLRLVTLPPELRDYVMLHELCHLRYMNHSPQFHALLEQVCPGHRTLEKQLRAYTPRGVK